MNTRWKLVRLRITALFAVAVGNGLLAYDAVAPKVHAAYPPAAVTQRVAVGKPFHKDEILR
jgi:hypothetical protein